MIGFMGGGNMAEAIIRGLIRNEHGLDAGDIIVSDPAIERREIMQKIGCRVTSRNEDICASAIIFLAVKPAQVREVLTSCANLLERKLLISIVAGVTTQAIVNLMGEKIQAAKTHVVRVMPNLPVAYNEGMSVIASNPQVPPKETEYVCGIFEQLGEAILLDEKYFPAVTAVSGSGPAYVFLLTEMLERAAQTLGLPAEVSALLARQTVIGAAKLLAKSRDRAQTWRERVTSKGGTTAAALEHLFAHKFDELFIGAVEKAAHHKI